VNRVFKALSDPTRRRVLQLLRERPMSAGELSDHFAVSKPTMSRLKMSVLEEALLGFAQTFGWEMKPSQAIRSTADRGAKQRPLKGEA
jgi:predicted transcriptional regulator